MAKVSREKFKVLDDVFDKFTIRNLFTLATKAGFDEDTLSPISIGKEANVFSAKKDGSKGRVAVKVYRLETADFNRMYEYIRSDPRFEHLEKRRRKIIFAWCQREYRNLLVTREAGVKAPRPIAFLDNTLAMEFIGNGNAAPMLKDGPFSNPQAGFEKIITYIRRYYKAGYVHGDLSKFNILNHDEEPVLIDFSQATPLRNPIAEELLERDVKNVCDYFRRRGVEAKVEEVLKRIRE